jgi:hypothetical protein
VLESFAGSTNKTFSGCGGGAQPDDFYEWNISIAGGYTVSFGARPSAPVSTYGDPIVSVRTICSDQASELYCDWDGLFTDGNASIVQSGITPGTYYIVVDTSNGTFIDYALNVFGPW